MFRSRSAPKGAGTTCLPTPSTPSPVQNAGCFPWVACSISFAWRAPRSTSCPPGFSLKLSPVIHTYGRSWTPAGSPFRLCRACILAGLPPSDGVGSALTKSHTLAEKYFAVIQNQRSSAIKAIYIRPPHPPILVRLSQLTLRGSNAVPKEFIELVYKDHSYLFPKVRTSETKGRPE